MEEPRKSLALKLSKHIAGFFFAAVLLALGLASDVANAQAPVLTVITHGFEDSALEGDLGSQYVDLPWLTDMAHAINARQGGGVPIYAVTIQPSPSGFFLSTINAPPIGDFPAGAIITINWSAAAGCRPAFTLTLSSLCDIPSAIPLSPLYAPIALWPSAQIADEIAGMLTSNSRLMSLPIHLIGHSRGGSVMSMVALLLAKRGAWIDQLTTLDPHPVVGADASVSQVWQNVLFADNYWRAGAGGPDGQYISGTRNVDLNGVVVGGLLTSDAHTGIHTYYHGTVDTAVLTEDNRAIQDAWYPQGHIGRGKIGYYYSRAGGGESARKIDGQGDGLHTDLGGLGTRWTVDLDSTPVWPNIALQPLKSGRYSYQIGESIPVSFYYQDRRNGFRIIFQLDDDTNPYNATTAPCAQFNPSNAAQIPTGTFSPDSQHINSTMDFLLQTTNAAAGSCYLRAEIRNLEGLSRFDYLSTKVSLSAAPPAPELVPPTVLGPGDSSGPGVITVNLTPQFSWTSVSAASGGYKFYISQFPYGFSNIVYSTVVPSGTTFTIPAEVLGQGTRYRWNMTSFAGGVDSVVSNTLYFQTPTTTPTSYLVQTSASPISGGSTSGGGTKQSGVSVTVSATPNSGFTFTTWTENGVQVSTSASYSFTVNGNRNLSANFVATGIPPTIASQPQSVVATTGLTVVFRVFATGGTPLNYQWRKFGTAIAGQTSDTLSLSNVSPSDAGSYTVLVSNTTGNELSVVATLTVNAGNSLRIVGGLLLTQSPPYVTSGTATVQATIKNASSATLLIDRVEVDGSFQDYFNDPPYQRSWGADSFSPALSLGPGSTYAYSRTNTNEVFPGSATTASAQVYVKFNGVPGLQAVTDADPGSTALLGFQTINPNQVFPISTSALPVNGGTVSGGGSYAEGTLAILTANASSGFVFSYWTRNGVPVGNSTVYTFQVNGAPDIVANFVQILAPKKRRGQITSE